MTRLPRFHRADIQTALAFTSRDVAILRAVARHHFLRSSQIAALVGGSRQQVLRWLQLLYHHGHLERPRCQIDYYHQGGSRELVYGLTAQGGNQLAQTADFPIRWTGSGEVKRLYLEHALLVSEVAVAMESAKNETVRFLHEHDLPATRRQGQIRPPFVWGVDVSPGLHIGLHPDKVFGLQCETDEPPALFFLEADRGTRLTAPGPSRARAL